MDFDFSWMSAPIFWLAAAIIFVVVEGLTMGLTTIWFAGGAIIALIAALLGAGLAVQIVLFFGVSVVLLLLTRKLFVKKLRTGQEKTNIEALIGKEAVAISAIGQLSTGRVMIGGQEWSAVCGVEGLTIEEGTKVKVTAIEGVKAIVIPLSE